MAQKSLEEDIIDVVMEEATRMCKLLKDKNIIKDMDICVVEVSNTLFTLINTGQQAGKDFLNNKSQLK